MQFGYSETCLAHDTGKRHPETADRLRAIRRALAKRHGVEYVEADPADDAAVAAVHEEGYVDEIRSFCEEGGGNWDPDTVASEDTWDAALVSAGLAQWAARAAVEGADERDTPFSLGRPPGHHAVENDAMGFCFINNAAVAAQTVIDDDELDAERVAIFDWDVHHGNGTQDIFYDRGDVFYASLHEGGLYPGTGEIDEIGEGDGEGTTLNVPLEAGAGDADYELVISEVLRPALEQFDPDLIIISAGFDAHRHDPISRMRVSTEGYAQLTDSVRAIANDVDAGLAFVLEGGYGLDTLSEGVAIVHETFDGRTPMEIEEDHDEKTEAIIEDVLDAHGIDG
ncbi:deacetylase [Halogeometricum borinquense DSM 11551]|uniref:Deacetylase n=1 Tax=Halogeometricum borinquense (strain ATCC 700274 / DSM 11551 / JCM 10706 / KCTC 4070 / PR3) TaxID=469382 RepID=E4NTS6_HALBP|nr:histone deacetylase [Halogeometricum borinquense]ADQ68231.1 deacetylase, histone deacetylase/acetoin utilization protein [Halogeometricum borinquense DSM 11551]ELY24725.1 deacetylase [Halogeometricum borinquense DSM 11551]